MSQKRDLFTNTAVTSLLLFLLVLILSLTAIVSSASDDNDNLLFNVWPQPKSWRHQQQRVRTPLSRGIVIPRWRQFSFHLSRTRSDSLIADSDLLNRAFSRYSGLIFFNQDVPDNAECPPGAVACVSRVRVVLDRSMPSLSDATSIARGIHILEQQDESYRLELPCESDYTSIELRARSEWGVLRGLETLSQMVSIEDGYYTVVTPELSPIVIEDAPRFPWRGFMIDTSRHYYTVDTILRIVDSMSYIKLNTLHWHLVDAESFPLVVPEAPLLSGKGAYAPHAVYTPEDIKKVVDYARDRGIHVVPEIDTPGHAASWGKGYPDSVAKCPKYEHNINNIPLNPVLDITYELLERILTHLSRVMDSDFIHIGADELVMGCWKEDPDIVAFMKRMGWTDYDQLLGFFEQQQYRMLDKLGKKMICWQELLLKHDQNIVNLPKDTIVQVWTRNLPLNDVVSRGYRALVSGGWYLDHQIPTKDGSSHYGWVDTWMDFYDLEPFDIVKNTTLQRLILGGEACMWSEGVDDVNFDSRVFPRVLGAAERLWSPMKLTRDVSTKARLEQARCNVLVKRGIGAGPVMPGYCPFTYSNKR